MLWLFKYNSPQCEMLHNAFIFPSHCDTLTLLNYLRHTWITANYKGAIRFSLVMTKTVVWKEKKIQSRMSELPSWIINMWNRGSYIFTVKSLKFTFPSLMSMVGNVCLLPSKWWTVCAFLFILLKKKARKYGSFKYVLLMHNLTVNSYNFLLCAAESKIWVKHPWFRFSQHQH